MHVPLRLLGQAVRLVDALAELDDPAGFPAVVLPGLAQLVGCEVLTYNEIGLVAPEVRYLDYPVGTLDEASREVFAAHVHEHPLVNHYRRTRDVRPVKMSDFVSRRQFHSLGLYTEFFGKIPVEYQLGAAVLEPGQRLIAVAFNRARKDFSETDRDLVTALQSPLSAAMRRITARRDARLARNAAIATCDGTEPEGHADLTPREMRTLELVAKGYTNTAIAHTLDISPRTVAKHLEHIYRKLGVQNRAAAIASTSPHAIAADRSLYGRSGLAVFSNPDHHAAGLGGCLGLAFFYAVEPVAKLARDRRARRVGGIAMDLHPLHAGKRKSHRGERPGRRGGVAAPGVRGVNPVTHFDGPRAAAPVQPEHAQNLARPH